MSEQEGRLQVTITGSWPVTPGFGGYSECQTLAQAAALELSSVLHSGEPDLRVIQEWVTFMEDLHVEVVEVNS